MAPLLLFDVRTCTCPGSGRCARDFMSSLLPPSPPAEKATARQHQPSSPALQLLSDLRKRAKGNSGRRCPDPPLWRRAGTCHTHAGFHGAHDRSHYG